MLHTEDYRRPKLNKCRIQGEIHPCGFSCNTSQGGGSVVVDSLFIIAPDVCGFFVFGPCLCNAVLNVLSSFSLRKRAMVALL